MAPRSYGADKARENLAQILDEAHHGKVTLVTKRGKPYAAVVPVEHAQQPRRAAGLLSLRGTGRGLWGSVSGKHIESMRNEWE